MLNRSPENNHQAASPFLPHLLHPSELYHSYSRSVCVASCLQFLLCSSIYICMHPFSELICEKQKPKNNKKSIDRNGNYMRSAAAAFTVIHPPAGNGAVL